MHSIGILILAAGASSRMGQPKQLLPWQGSTVLRHMANQACAVKAATVMVALGHEAERCATTLHDLPLQITLNPQWQEGMGSTIAHGTTALLDRAPHLAAILIMQCDQIAVSTRVLEDIIHIYLTTQSQVIFSEYADTLGAPALFSQPLFPHLLALKGPQGAKPLWSLASQKQRYPFPPGIHDLDTWEQYQTLQANEPH